MNKFYLLVIDSVLGEPEADRVTQKIYPILLSNPSNHKVIDSAPSTAEEAKIMLSGKDKENTEYLVIGAHGNRCCTLTLYSLRKAGFNANFLKEAIYDDKRVFLDRNIFDWDDLSETLNEKYPIQDFCR